ncbi:MAG: class I SAM-dependent methyltransferase [Gammaproteobacteria bacterium]|nr:MAG: class I SAM-dependent methyltransferase [Gammaproteobacteria bacterium]
MADKADINVLYEQSVQCVESEIDFVDETFQQLRGRKAKLLREDFCGTANTSCEWIRRRKTNKAISVDLNNDVLKWGRQHKVGKLNKEQKKRITLINDNVLDVKTGKIDTALAMNFSYWIFEDRPTMIKYFKKIHKTLVDDGIFFLDAFGGYEAYQEMKERTEHDKFTYVWDQASYNPVTGHCQCYIHFKFKDGSKINKAFSYAWRLWSLPELTEMLTEAGFKATVYWEGTDEDTDEGNGIFEPSTEGEADAGWIAYIVAEK